MIKFKRILFPTDFSLAAQHALDFAISLALEHEATLFLAHVIDEIETTPPSSLSSFPAKVEYHHGINDHIKNNLEKAICSQLKRQIKVEEMVIRGRPAVEIVRLAGEIDADLIVLPTHSHDGVRQAHLGSNAERIIRKAPCPVLVIRHPDYQFTKGQKLEV